MDFKEVTSEVYSTPKRLIFYYEQAYQRNIETEAKKIKRTKSWSTRTGHYRDLLSVQII